MASQSSSPNVSGPLAGMFTTEAQQAIIAEEAADLLAQEQNIERATIAAAAATAAAAAAAEVEATASALLGSVQLPVQQAAHDNHELVLDLSLLVLHLPVHQVKSRKSP